MSKEEEQSNAMRPDAVRNFNEFQSQSRARIETTVKYVLLISGSMLTLSVSAILNDHPAHIAPELLPILKAAWITLFYSIAASLVLMVLLVISTYHMGMRWAELLCDDVIAEKGKIIRTWPILEIINWIIGISGSVACLMGIALIAYVAIGVAGGGA